MPSNFVHLHVHTHYSLLRALPKPDELVKAVKGMGMDAVAITDYAAVYGVIEFIQECRKKEIKPIIGQCANMALDKLTDKRPRIDDKSHQVVLLCETMEGYKNLLKLTTIAHLEGFYYKPRIDKEVLQAHAKGLIGLSGGKNGEISKALAMDEFGKAEAIAREYAEIFGEGNFFLELQDHPELDEQVSRNNDLLRLSKATGIPVVATKDVHYLKPDDAEAHDVLTCIGDGKTLDDERRARTTDADYSLVSGEHMEKAFADVPEAILNTRRIADRCNVELELGKWNFAEIAVPEGETHATWLSKEAYAGIAKKVPEVDAEIRERMEYELGIINQKGYAPYFLVVSDYMRWAKAHGIMTTTRGSAAGSLVSYAIDIVPVNPLVYKLPFERFLNPFRPSPPDIDGDFEDTRRDEVIAYVTEKYGRDRVAQIGTFGTMAARGSVRDVGRVLALPYSLCDRISKLIPMGSQGFPMTIERAIETTPELRDEMSKDPQVRRLLALAQRVEGSARHVSVHAAGVVIAPKPLTEYTALQRESGGEKLITQYEMNSIEAAGVLKSDFLGIRNLSILGGAVKIIARTKGIKIDLDNIPLDDAKTYKMLADGDTTGTFQLNGAGMTRYLKELKPTTIHDIMAMVALFRPGPMEMIPDYIKRKHDPSLVAYLDPRLKPILEKSYGIMTYQDDVLLTSIHLAGYNWEEADKFRKAMGKKIPEEMMKQKEKFLSGCVKGGMTTGKSEQLWKLIEPFAAYGFNKCLTGDTRVADPVSGTYRTLKEMFDEGKDGSVATLKDDMKIQVGERCRVITNGVKQVFSLKTRSGRRIRATGNHPFLTIDGWQQLDGLSEGGRIALPRRLPTGAGVGGDVKRWRALGYLIAEGNLCHPSGVYYYSSVDAEIADFVRCMGAFPNVRMVIDRSKSAAAVYVGKNEQSGENGLREWLEMLGVMGKKATEKELPTEVYAMDEAELSQLLAGMWQGDGCVHSARGGQVFYATSSAVLADQVQHLLLRLGIFSTRHEKTFAYRGGHRAGYTVNLSGNENVRRFSTTIGALLLPNKQRIVDAIVKQLDETYEGTEGVIARGTKDIVPATVLGSVRQEMAFAGQAPVQFAKRIGLSVRLFGHDERRIGFTRPSLSRMAEGLDSPSLRKLAESDIYWDEIVSIQPDGVEMTYDLEVPGSHNFVANDIIVHNSHACAYGMVAYQTSYLKANWPSEYMTAVLSAEAGDAETIATVVADCKKMGIEVLPPDVNSSGTDFTYITDTQIRFGLMGIKNLGDDVAKAMISEREEHGPYLTLADMASRVAAKSYNKKSVEALIKSGALDALGERNMMLGSIDQILAYHKEAMKDVSSGQFNMFGKEGEKSVRGELELRPAPPATKRERLAWERELLGLYISEHPFKEYAEFFGEALMTVKDLPSKKGQPGLFSVGGIIMDVRVIFTKKKNEPMAFVKLEDMSGTVEVVVFPSTYKTNVHALVKDAAVLVEGKFDEKEGEPKVLAEKLTIITAENANDVREMLTHANPARAQAIGASAGGAVERSAIFIAVPPTMAPTVANELKRIFGEYPGGRKVFLKVKTTDGSIKKIETNFHVAFSGDMIAEVEKLVGKGAVLSE